MLWAVSHFVCIAALCEGAGVLCFSLLITYVFCYEIALSGVPVALCFLESYGEGTLVLSLQQEGSSSCLLGEPQRELSAVVKILVLLTLMTSNFAFSLSLAQLQA